MFICAGYEDYRQRQARPSDCDVQCHIPKANGSSRQEDTAETY